MNYKKPNAYLLHATPLEIAEVSGRVCYNSFGLSEHDIIRNFPSTKNAVNPVDKIEHSELLDKLSWVHHHHSILEHINLSYYIENVSREIIIEANRHRIGIATSQKSSRYTIEDLIDAWVDLNNNFFDAETHNMFEKVVKENIVHENFMMIQNTADYLYKTLEEYNKTERLIKGLTGSKKKKQNDRVKRALPESWMLDGVWTFNLRALKHFIELRDSGAAYYGIREFTQAIIDQTPKKYLDLIYKKRIINE